jgi:ribosomal protein S15P/S13E
MASGDVSTGAAVVAADAAAGPTISEMPNDGTDGSGTSGNTTAAKTRSGTPAAADGGLQQLYLSRGQLAADIQAAEAARSGTSRLAGGGVPNLTALPAEDPLLSEARSQVRSAASDLQTLRIDLADDNPEVVAARERLKEAQARLRLQSKAMQKGQTSDEVQLNAMRAKYAAVTKQISAAEKDFKTGRRYGALLEQQRNDALLKLEVYKTAASQYAVLTMQTVAGGNLMDVIDEGRVPVSGKPGAGVLAAVSIGLMLFILNLWLSIEYLVRMRRKSRQLLMAGRAAQQREAQALEAQELETQQLEAQNGIAPR